MHIASCPKPCKQFQNGSFKGFMEHLISTRCKECLRFYSLLMESKLKRDSLRCPRN